MADKKDKNYFDKPDQELDVNLPIIPEAKKPVYKTVYYTRAMWSGVQEIFKCSKCGSDRNTQDEMIMHVLLHVPPKEREELFDKLMEARI